MPAHARVRFAEFAFDPATGELWRGDIAVPLEHQPALVLSHLIASAGRVVTREELASAVWGAGTHVKFDDGLNYCIRQIRAALGDDAKAPRFVETLPRRGYRFVTMTSPQHGSTEARKHRSYLGLGHAPRYPWLRVAAALAAVIVAVAIAETRPNNHHAVAASMARSLHDLIF